MLDGLGIIDMRKRQGPLVSRQPVMMGLPVGLYIFTACFVNITVQLASHIFPTPTKFSWNPGITWPVVGNSEGSSVINRSHILAEVIYWPEAVPTRIRGAVGYTFFLVASFGEELASGAQVYYF